MKFRLLMPHGGNFKSKQYQMICPFHKDEHMGNFSINVESGLYYCFSCNAKGNIISFVEEVYNLENNYKKTADFINRKLGYEEFEIYKREQVAIEDYYVQSAHEVLRQQLTFDIEVLEQNQYLIKKFAREGTKNIFNLLGAGNGLCNLKEENFQFNKILIEKTDLIFDFKYGFQVIKENGDKLFIGSPKNNFILMQNEDNPYIICEGLATALTYYLLEWNVIVCFQKTNIIPTINKFNNILHCLFVSVDGDKDALKSAEEYKKNGVTPIVYEGQQVGNKWKGLDANDYYSNKGKEVLILHIEKEVKKYSYSNYILRSGLRVYCNAKREYLVIIHGVLFKCGKNIKSVLEAILQNLKWFNKPDIKNIKTIVEHYICNNILYYTQLGYNPDFLYLEEYHKDGKVLINTYQVDGLQKKSKNNLHKGKFDTIKLIINNNTEDNFEWFSNFIANKIHNPTKKAHLGILIYSDGYGGTGKSSLGQVLHSIFGNNIVLEVSQESLNRGWNDSLFNCLLWIAEDISLDDGNISQKIKTALSSSNMQKRQRNTDDIVMENYANGIIFSDKNMPLQLEDNDNRRFVVFKSKGKIDPEIGKKISEKEDSIMKEIEAYYNYLLEYDCKRVEVIETESKESLKSASKDHTEEAIDRFVEDLINGELNIITHDKTETVRIKSKEIARFIDIYLRGRVKQLPTVSKFVNLLKRKVDLEYKSFNFKERDGSFKSCFALEVKASCLVGLMNDKQKNISE